MQSVFTVAMGSAVYLDYAFNLARSFLIHHQNSKIKFVIFTDIRTELPNDLKGIELIRLSQGVIGEGITCKLYLDQLAPTQKSLFIDADCLCYGNLDSTFEKFCNHAVSVVGFQIKHGEWCGLQAEDLCVQFNINSIPRFNGGVYYIEKGEKATKIYETARNLLSKYDQLGFFRHRGWANEEPLMSLAIALNEETPVIDDGTIMSDLASCLDGSHLNVLTGKCHLNNPSDSDLKHKWWYDFSDYYPVIIHFSGDMGRSYPYTKEKLNLTLSRYYKYPNWFIYLISYTTISLPYKIFTYFKNIFRPTYRLLFGYRAIKQSDRTFSSDDEQKDN